MFRKILKVTSKAEGDIIDITSDVEKAVRESRMQEGLVILFVRHSTAALTTIEFEPGITIRSPGGRHSVIAPGPFNVCP